MKKKCKKISQKKEIVYNIVNSILAGSLVLLGSFSSGNITQQGFTFAIIAGLAVAVTQFKDYWTSEKSEYTTVKVFSLVHA